MKEMSTYELDDTFCMSNLYSKHTGLPVILLVDCLGCARNVQNNLPRLKVQNVKGDKAVDDAFSLSIEEDPKILAGTCKLSSKDLKIVKKFVSDHFEDLLLHWNQKIDEDELKEILYIH